MQLHHAHPWDVTPGEAAAIQQRLQGFVETSNRLGRVNRVAGVDVGFEERGRVTRAAIAVLSLPGLVPMESAVARLPTGFPYVPGLLSFREVPAVLAAMEQLHRLPDLLLCDGQGIAHPRRLGIACHLGLLTDIPAIGVAKSRLTGEYREPGQEKGSWSPLQERGECIGAVLRTRHGVKPLFVSPGHRIDLATSIDFVMACLGRYRLPETTRLAHRLASG